MADLGLAPVTLDTKYDLDTRELPLTGVRALVRPPMLRRRLNQQRGWRTAGLVSGYRGSPLGTHDTQRAAACRRLDVCDVVVWPGVNEDLPATAVWGAQQVNLYVRARCEEVFGIGYGETPSVDRSIDDFGRTRERRIERSLADQLIGLLEKVAVAVAHAGLGDLLAVLAAPGAVRGYGHVKAAALLVYRAWLEGALTSMRRSEEAKVKPGAPRRAALEGASQ